MLEQKKGPDGLIEEDDQFLEALWKIEFEEDKIDMEKEIYLITWAPDPKELPDADFLLQHNYNVDTLVKFLKSCSCGLFCVESTQLGNPHYHGWYQVHSDPRYEAMRIAIVKTMKRFAPAGLKITPARKVKIHCWSHVANGLYYYKKDIATYYINMPNPINSETVSTVNFEEYAWAGFFCSAIRRTNVVEKLSDRKYYESFYSNTVSTLNGEREDYGL